MSALKLAGNASSLPPAGAQFAARGLARKAAATESRGQARRARRCASVGDLRETPCTRILEQTGPGPARPTARGPDDDPIPIGEPDEDGGYDEDDEDDDGDEENDGDYDDDG